MLETYLRISLSLTMRLISATNASLTHTDDELETGYDERRAFRTLFPDKAIVAVVGVVCITGRCAAAISKHPKVEL